MYDVNIRMVPSYIQDLISPLVSENSDSPLRNNRNRTCNSQKSCIPSSITLWNSLDDDLKTINMTKIVSKYDQEIPQSQTADNPVAPRGRAAQPSRDTRKTN